MPYFIDRRLNPKDKSLGNRQRFMRRAKAQIKEAVSRTIRDRTISDADNGETISIPTKGIGEPRFVHDSKGGQRHGVLPHNKEFTPGDRIPKPPQGDSGEGGSKPSDGGEGEDDFRFMISREEFLDIFFEDLELPDLVKKNLKEVYADKPQRAGYTTSGTPTMLNLKQTMRNSFGRRLALKRPRTDEMTALEKEIFALEGKLAPTEDDRARLRQLHIELEDMNRKRRAVPYIDPIDIRYNKFEPRPVPTTQAVMFCLMDVSGSMGEREKDLAKRFFILLHLFLKRRYKKIDVVFIRHTHEAQVVDEETFFYSRESGGTVVSTALIEMMKVVRDRYNPEDWNIYAAQASDGDDFAGDAEKCVNLLQQEIMPASQYYAYVEILDEREYKLFQDPDSGAALWRAYRSVGASHPTFAMKRVAQQSDIYPVFRELFSSREE